MYVMWKCLDWDLKTCRWYSDSGTHGNPAQVPLSKTHPLYLLSYAYYVINIWHDNNTTYETNWQKHLFYIDKSTSDVFLPVVLLLETRTHRLGGIIDICGIDVQ